jgi:hypothetical protein
VQFNFESSDNLQKIPFTLINLYQLLIRWGLSAKDVFTEKPMTSQYSCKLFLSGLNINKYYENDNKLCS